MSALRQQYDTRNCGVLCKFSEPQDRHRLSCVLCCGTAWAVLYVCSLLHEHVL
jgi:hypothetical protein